MRRAYSWLLGTCVGAKNLKFYTLALLYACVGSAVSLVITCTNADRSWVGAPPCSSSNDVADEIVDIRPPSLAYLPSWCPLLCNSVYSLLLLST